jgi:Protein of unknown function (DUF3572)
LENKLRPKSPPGGAEASAVALTFISYLASDDERLQRFCDYSGMGGNDIKQRLQEPDFHAFLFDYLMQDESSLLAFCAENAIQPEKLMRLRATLPGFTE